MCVLGREADSVNVTRLTGTHSSDNCAIPPSVSPCLISINSPVFPALVFFPIFYPSLVSQFLSLFLLPFATSCLLPPLFFSLFLYMQQPTQTSMNNSDCVALQVFPLPALTPPLFSFFLPSSASSLLSSLVHSKLTSLICLYLHFWALVWFELSVGLKKRTNTPCV